MSVLILPGYFGSGPTHWQSRWQALHPELIRVEQRDWQQPDCAEWMAVLTTAVQAAAAPVYLVAHSLGCLLVAHWAAQHDSGKVAGALLVAPPNPWRDDYPEACMSFATLELAQLPFASLVVASRNDPYAGYDFAETAAAAWGAQLVDAGEAGHINAESNLGDWPQGWALLEQLQTQSVIK
ncbi:RBBP9/YdeN family alpha/beta hydrolase [Chitinilyticum piscinae]|uniref:Alpha/beta hydrolase n=1 Tax=Chitinilyticum piscinae TaxID=2866724 RepID=A0A8J7FLH2_9NEIS|nr:alpha/beta fold hydrolase [Chitinilyticum piscinae]MBE9610047.1 alpha/beta hydrolase [Chitinilyticum piscinae]